MVCLRFVIHNDASSKYRHRWTKLKAECESGWLPTSSPFNNNDIICEWIALLRERDLGRIIDRQVLNRVEGGLGGSNIVTDRQLRFRCNFLVASWQKPNDIVIDSQDSRDGKNKWSMYDLEIFGAAFKHILEHRMGGKYVFAHISIPICSLSSDDE